MAKSQLFGGKKEQLNAYQQRLEELYDKLDRPGQRITPEQFFKRPEVTSFVNAQFGEIQVPPGSEIISQSPTEVRFRDAEGFEHTLSRDIRETGRVNEQTNRPAVLPLTKQIPQTQQLLSQASGALGQLFGAGQQGQQQGANIEGDGGQFFGLPPGSNETPGLGTLGNLSPADKALLDQITKSNVDQLRQQFTNQGGQLIAQLFSRGMNESSLAGDAVMRLQQGQGLVESQALSEGAGRELGIRQFLTQLTTGAGLDLLNSIIGGDTQRAIASGNIGLGQRQLDEGALQAVRNQGLDQQKIDVQRSQNSWWRSVLSAAASVGAAAIPGLLPAKMAAGGLANIGSISSAGGI